MVLGIVQQSPSESGAKHGSRPPWPKPDNGPALQRFYNPSRWRNSRDWRRESSTILPPLSFARNEPLNHGSTDSTQRRLMIC